MWPAGKGGAYRKRSHRFHDAVLQDTLANQGALQLAAGGFRYFASGYENQARNRQGKVRG